MNLNGSRPEWRWGIDGARALARVAEDGHRADERRAPGDPRQAGREPRRAHLARRIPGLR